MVCLLEHRPNAVYKARHHDNKKLPVVLPADLGSKWRLPMTLRLQQILALMYSTVPKGIHKPYFGYYLVWVLYSRQLVPYASSTFVLVP